MQQNKVFALYRQLYTKYGDPALYWPNWCAKKKDKRLREIILLGAILTQRTSWHNAEIALQNLKNAHALSVHGVSKLSPVELEKLIRVAGFYTTKPKRLLGLCNFVEEQGGTMQLMRRNLDLLRKELLLLYGIGPETADTILLYGCDKPSFVIDEYTKRFVRKFKLAKKFDYDFLKGFFEKHLPRNHKVFRDFHALIIIDQRGIEGSKMHKF